MANIPLYQRLNILDRYMMTEQYYTNMDGKKKYLVRILDNRTKVHIFTCRDGKFDHPVAKYEPNKIFLGDNEYKGNSILLELPDDLYIYIGYCIYRFKARFKIVFFISEIFDGTSYPYAVDEKKHHYLMYYSVMLTNYTNDQCPYDYYDQNIDMGILYSNNEQYSLIYSPFPIAYYANLPGSINEIARDNTRYKLTKADYINLAHEWGKEKGFAPLYRTILVLS